MVMAGKMSTYLRILESLRELSGQKDLRIIEVGLPSLEYGYRNIWILRKARSYCQTRGLNVPTSDLVPQM